MILTLTADVSHTPWPSVVSCGSRAATWFKQPVCLSPPVKVWKAQDNFFNGDRRIIALLVMFKVSVLLASYKYLCKRDYRVNTFIRHLGILSHWNAEHGDAMAYAGLLREVSC